MLRLLNFLSDTMTETTPSVKETVSYTLPEIIFWYSAFALVLVLFIIFIFTRKGNRKKLDIMTGKISKSCSLLDTIVKSLELNKKAKFSKEKAQTISLTISSFYIDLIEMKEKTRLDDFDKIIANCEEIEAHLKRLSSVHGDRLIDELKQIKDELIKIKGQVELVKTYLH